MAMDIFTNAIRTSCFPEFHRKFQPRFFFCNALAKSDLAAIRMAILNSETEGCPKIFNYAIRRIYAP